MRNKNSKQLKINKKYFQIDTNNTKYKNIIILTEVILFVIITIYLYFVEKPEKEFINQSNIYDINDSFRNYSKTKFIDYLNNSKEIVKKPRLNNYVNYTLKKLYWNNETKIDIDKVKKEIQILKNFNISYENKVDFTKRENPKVSLVIPLHNQCQYIKLIYSSIHKQDLKDIEIIFVNDASKDNTSLIVKELMEKDKRIIYLENDINRRAFYTRNKGILKATGEYILVIDPDDLLINNILIKAYETAKKYDLDIVHFYVLRGYFENPSLWRSLKYRGGILKNNKEIKINFYHTISRNLWDKLIKRTTYIKSIFFMRKEFYNQVYILNNDDTAFFGLLHVAETYGFLEQIGYFYIWRPKGVYYYRKDRKKANLIFLSVFNNMKYFYIQSDNTTIEKNNLAYKYFLSSYRNFGAFIPNLTESFDFFIDVLDLYLNSSYFSNDQKLKLNEVKSRIIWQKKSLKL